MRWKVDALIETRFDGPDDEAVVKRTMQKALWRLVESLEAELQNPMGTSVVVMSAEPVGDEAP